MTDQTAPVLSEEDDLRALARVIRDAGISGVKGEHVGPFDLSRADAVLSSDWLAAYVARHRQQAVREALAEVEALADEWWQDRKMRTRMSRGYAVDLRAAIARTKGVDA